MNILIIDDHRLFADGLRLVLNELEAEDKLSIESAYNAQRALNLIDSGKHFDLIITDLEMPGIDGHELVKSLSNRNIRTTVVVISASTDVEDMNRAYRQGARGYIVKSDSAQEMLIKIRNLISGKTNFPDEFWDRLKDGSSHLLTPAGNSEGLGERPMEVLRLLSKGMSNKQIAELLGISETTVKFHVRTLFSVFGVNNRTWCVREAGKRGLVETSP